MLIDYTQDSKQRIYYYDVLCFHLDSGLSAADLHDKMTK